MQRLSWGKVTRKIFAPGMLEGMTKPLDPIADATPRCEQCLVSLVPEGAPDRARWRCPSCGLVRL